MPDTFHDPEDVASAAAAAKDRAKRANAGFYVQSEEFSPHIADDDLVADALQSARIAS